MRGLFYDRPLCSWVFESSTLIAEDIDPYSGVKKAGLQDLIRGAEGVTKSDVKLREFITLKAYRVRGLDPLIS